MSDIRIVMAQLNFTVGNLENNKNIILEAINSAENELAADIIVFPELALTGYPPEDLLTRLDFHQAYEQALQEIISSKHKITVILGHPKKIGEKIYNAASIFSQGKIIQQYFKQILPNYGVFDEKRYFTKGEKTCIFKHKGCPIGLVICEDLWFEEPIKNCQKAGAQLVISINASPFDIFKLKEREKVMLQRIHENKIPIMYVHNVGGQD
ncbi:MAG: nitrilase-related carbon-nitrogen hydrolase, partial [Pseudomonadota bacterium]